MSDNNKINKSKPMVVPKGPGGRQMAGAGAKPANAGKTLKRIFSYMTSKWYLLVIVAVCVLCSSGAMIAGNYLLRPLLNDYIIPFIGQSNPDLTGFISLLVIMAVLYGVGVLATWINNRIMLTLATKTLFRIRTELFEKMEKLPLKYFDSHSHGEIMSLYTNDTDTLRDMLSQSVPQLLSSLFTVVGVFTMMVVLSPILTLLVVVMIGLMIFITGKIGMKSGKAFKAQQENLGKVNGYIEEMIEGQKVVQVFCREEISKADFAQLNNNLREAGTRAHTFANILGPLMNNLSHVNYALTAIAGAVLVIMGKLDLGAIASFLQYTKNFSQPISQMSTQFNGILNALAGAERIFRLIDEERETDEGKVTLVQVMDYNGVLTESFAHTGMWAWKKPDTGELIPLKGDVRFQDVSFGYKENKTVLHHIDLFAEPGQKIALVGSTGSGKTTITNLINRFYDINQGAITYDGIPIKDISKDALRSSLGMVLQDTHLFTGTIADNIRYGKLSASMPEIIGAAKLANADTFINHLEKGYDTLITGDGGNLSQGQRQLLAIARAAVADPPVLILDEATSSIDTRTESLIQKGMDTLMEGRTVFVIAHRLSTVRNADVILVLENGQIIERGSHDQLIAQKGKYYQLYTGAFELE